MSENWKFGLISFEQSELEKLMKEIQDHFYLSAKVGNKSHWASSDSTSLF